jgi:hypothetical protein
MLVALVDKRFKQLNVTPEPIDAPLPVEQNDPDWKLVHKLNQHIEKLVNDDWEASVEFGVTT